MYLHSRKTKNQFDHFFSPGPVISKNKLTEEDTLSRPPVLVKNAYKDVQFMNINSKAEIRKIRNPFIGKEPKWSIKYENENIQHTTIQMKN